MSTQPAGPRPGTETATVIPGYRLAQLKITGALAELEKAAFAVAKERDEVGRSYDEKRQEVERLRARVEELEGWLRNGCPAHGFHPHGDAVCLDCPICRPGGGDRG